MQRLHVPTISFPQPCASDLKTLTFGIEMLDRLFGELSCGKLVLFHGSKVCHVLSELLCVRSQLSRDENGLDSSVVFIDGGNLFDLYLIAETAHLLGLEPEKALKNIWVSRAFTSYQLTALITEKLPEILEQEGSKLVVISDIAALYCDPDIGSFEAKRTFNQVTCFLWNLAREKGLLLVTTLLSSRNKRKRQLEHYLVGRADISVKIEDGNPSVRLTLEKHHSKPACSMTLFFEEPKAQSLLEEFMEV